MKGINDLQRTWESCFSGSRHALLYEAYRCPSCACVSSIGDKAEILVVALETSPRRLCHSRASAKDSVINRCTLVGALQR